MYTLFTHQRQVVTQDAAAITVVKLRPSGRRQQSLQQHKNTSLHVINNNATSMVGVQLACE